MIFIVQGFRIIIYIFIVIFTTFWVKYPPVFFWTYRPKRCEYNNKDEDNNPKTLNDKNHQSPFQKFIIYKCLAV